VKLKRFRSVAALLYEARQFLELRAWSSPVANVNATDCDYLKARLMLVPEAWRIVS
jgi:hypothetical protein